MDSHIILILLYLFLFYYLLLFHYYFRHYRNSWYSSEVIELKFDDKVKFTNLSKYPSDNIGDCLIKCRTHFEIGFYFFIRGLSVFFCEHSISARVSTRHRVDQFGSNQKVSAVKPLNPILHFEVDRGRRHQGRQNSVGR